MEWSFHDGGLRERRNAKYLRSSSSSSAVRSSIAKAASLLLAPPTPLSGGNPALQPLGALIERGRARGYGFAAETQGSVDADWFAALDWLVLSPKPPSSAMAIDWIAMDACLGVAGSKPRCVLKVVVFDDVDYGFAREAAERYPELPIYLQVGGDETLLDDSRALADRAKAAGVEVRLDVFPGMLHSFQMMAGRAPEAEALDQRSAAIRQAAHGSSKTCNGCP